MPYPQKWLDEICYQNSNNSKNFNESEWAKFTFEKLTILANKALKNNQQLKEFSLSGTLLSEKYLFGKTLEAKQTQNHRMTNLQKLLKRS